MGTEGIYVKKRRDILQKLEDGNRRLYASFLRKEDRVKEWVSSFLSSVFLPREQNQIMKSLEMFLYTWSIAEDCRWEQTEPGTKGQMDTPSCSHLKLSYLWRRAGSCIVHYMYGIIWSLKIGKEGNINTSLPFSICSLLISGTACMLLPCPRSYLMSLWSCSYWDLSSLWSPWLNRLKDARTHRKKNAMFA